MPDACPLIELHQILRRTLRRVDPTVLLTELGIPANLESLIDGLRRTRACMERFPAELDICLRLLPPDRLGPQELIDGIDQVLAWAATQPWPDDDLRRLPMQGADHAGRHPLAGYCLSILLHWVDLYYVPEPDAGGSPPDRLTDSYESLLAEFSSYVIAAQASIEPDAYLGFCRKWWAASRLPHVNLYSPPRLASRVAGASRAFRRLTLLEHRTLLDYLVDPANGGVLHERIFAALDGPWRNPEPTTADADKEGQSDEPSDDEAEEGPAEHGEAIGNQAPDEDPVARDRHLLNQIALLLEDVRPRWMRPNRMRRHVGQRHGHGRATSQHRTFRDGYVRIPEQDAVRVVFETDEGFHVEHLQPLPASDADAVEEDGDDETGPSRTSRAKPETPAEREARITRDGTKWIPVGEQQTDADFDIVPLPDSVDGDRRTQTTRWAKNHMRRNNLALGISKDRLLISEAGALLRVIYLEELLKRNPVYIALHACLALGRSLRQLEGFEIHRGAVSAEVDPDRIHYFWGSELWVLPSPVPAWADLPTEPIERPRLPQITLPDCTGFSKLFKDIFLLRNDSRPDASIRPFQKLSKDGQARVQRVLTGVLASDDATPARCASFLFHRLLEVTRGDLGIASLITGRDHSHSSSVRHYANYPAAQLWAAYRDAWEVQPPPSHVDVPPASVEPVVADNPYSQGYGYGAKRVPTAQAVRNLVALLARASRDHAQSQQARHNAYTAYTLVGMVLGLAMRPIIEPMLTGVGHSHRPELLVSFLDKARSDYDRRINAIPGALAEHLRTYATYRSELALSLRGRAAKANFVYLAPDTGKAGPFHPGDFDKVVGDAFPLELYSIRRYARSELADNYHVDAEDLDAYMGHWFFGVSPFDPLSTYPMTRLRDFASGPVSGLLEAAGFAPLTAPACP